MFLESGVSYRAYSSLLNYCLQFYVIQCIHYHFSLFFPGSPTPVISWSKLRAPLPWQHKVNGGILTLNNVGRQDSGTAALREWKLWLILRYIRLIWVSLCLRPVHLQRHERQGLQRGLRAAGGGLWVTETLLSLLTLSSQTDVYIWVRFVSWPQVSVNVDFVRLIL